MADMKKLSDEKLENVTGGGERIVTAGSARVRSGPGLDYECIGTCYSGDHVYTAWLGKELLMGSSFFVILIRMTEKE